MPRPPAFDPEVREALRLTWSGRCWRCGGPGSDYAHRRPRGVRDEHSACFCNATWLDRFGCHSWCHKNPYDSRERGLTLSRYTTEPWNVPVLLKVGWSLLTCDRKVIQIPSIRVEVRPGSEPVLRDV